MATAVADLSDLLKGVPSGAWVAISEEDNTVLAFGADAQEVIREAKSKGVAVPLIVRKPGQNSVMFL